MKSIKTKILLPVFLIIILFVSFMGVQFIYAKNNMKLVKEMNAKYFTTISKADELKLDVVQVQQWLTDISATRSAKGLDDGFDEAEKHAQNVNVITEELKQINPEYIQDIEKIEKSFVPYYDTGKIMAKAYIEGGPDKGNLAMAEFDSSAETINSEVDKFKGLATENIKASIENIEKSISNTIILIGFAILILVIVSIISWKYVTKNIVNPITTMLSKLKVMANSG